MASIDEFPHRIRPAAGPPQGALVLLHGRATSEDDVFPLLDALDPGVLGDLAGWLAAR